jgi:hypothetical protein
MELASGQFARKAMNPLPLSSRHLLASLPAAAAASHPASSTNLLSGRDAETTSFEQCLMQNMHDQSR